MSPSSLSARARLVRVEDGAHNNMVKSWRCWGAWGRTTRVGERRRYEALRPRCLARAPSHGCGEARTSGGQGQRRGRKQRTRRATLTAARAGPAAVQATRAEDVSKRRPSEERAALTIRTDRQLGHLEQLLLERLLLLLQREARLRVQRREDVATLAVCRAEVARRQCSLVGGSAGELRGGTHRTGGWCCGTSTATAGARRLREGEVVGVSFNSQPCARSMVNQRTEHGDAELRRVVVAARRMGSRVSRRVVRGRGQVEGARRTSSSRPRA